MRERRAVVRSEEHCRRATGRTDDDRGARRARAQPRERRRRRAAESSGRHRRGVRLGQVVAGDGRPLRGGSRRYIEALSTYTRRRMSHAPRPPSTASGTSRPRWPCGSARAFPARAARSAPRPNCSTSCACCSPGSARTRLPERPPPGADDRRRRRPGPRPARSAASRSARRAPRRSPSTPTARARPAAAPGVVREIDDALLVPDPSLTIADGAVAPWKMFGLTVMPQIVGELGVRTDVPYRDLTDAERDIVLHGPAEKHQHHRAVEERQAVRGRTSPTATPASPCRRRSTRPPARAA